MAMNAERRSRARCGRWLVALASGVLLMAGCGGTDETGGPLPTDESSASCTDVSVSEGGADDGPTTIWEVPPDSMTPSSASTSTAGPGSSTATTGSTTTSSTTTTTTMVSPARAVYRGSQSRAVVALTFDAGADCGYAEQILDTLSAEGISATFGMTGRWAEANPGLVQRMVDEGHQMLNHTYDHPSFTGASTDTSALSSAERRSQLEQADAAVAAITGRSMKPWFRPPYGDIDDSVNVDLATAGYRYNVLWTVDSLGWKGLSADEIESRCLDRAGNGVIYLFHVGSQSRDAEALQAIIDGLRAQGYSFGTVDDIV